MLGASPESYRTWDAGRRATPPEDTSREPVRWRRIAMTTNSFHLPVLALLIGVHVKTLRSAARDGRLPVTYDTQTTFRQPPSAGNARSRPGQFRHVLPIADKCEPVDRRVPLTWASVPDDYD